MNDETDMWREYRKIGQKKKRNNLRYSTDYLKEHDIPYISHNNGIHLVVDSRVDFWPSTGLWLVRKTKKQGRGLMGLMQWLKSGT